MVLWMSGIMPTRQMECKSVVAVGKWCWVKSKREFWCLTGCGAWPTGTSHSPVPSAAWGCPRCKGPSHCRGRGWSHSSLFPDFKVWHSLLRYFSFNGQIGSKNFKCIKLLLGNHSQVNTIPMSGPQIQPFLPSPHSCFPLPSFSPLVFLPSPLKQLPPVVLSHRVLP